MRAALYPTKVKTMFVQTWLAQFSGVCGVCVGGGGGSLIPRPLLCNGGESIAWSQGTKLGEGHSR